MNKSHAHEHVFSLRIPSYYALLLQVSCNWRQLYYYNNYYKPSTVQDRVLFIEPDLLKNYKIDKKVCHINTMKSHPICRDNLDA